MARNALGYKEQWRSCAAKSPTVFLLLCYLHSQEIKSYQKKKKIWWVSAICYRINAMAYLCSKKKKKMFFLCLFRKRWKDIKYLAKEYTQHNGIH